MPNLTLTDLAGKTHQLSDFKAKQFLVIAYTSTSCPLCKKYAPTLAKLEKQYADKSVAFLFINPTATDATSDIKAQGLQGIYCQDRSNEATAALGAKTTTEVIVLDAARTVVYRGAVDDQYGIGYSLDTPKNNYLRDALDAALAGKQPQVEATTAPGCDLDVSVKTVAAVPVTYHARIARIVQMHCVECHRTNGVGPFSLETYDDVVSHKGMIRKVVDKGTMPPWFAVAAAAGKHSPWINDRTLPAQDKADLLAWLSGSLEKGDAADAPLKRTFNDQWQIGKPDKVLKFPKPVAVKADGVMPYQNIRVETGLEEDKWVQAIEVKPSARQVVHHVIVSVIPPGGSERSSGGATARLSEAAAERSGFFAIYVPGNSQLVFPEGFAKKLPKGSKLNFQMHYTPNGTATEDQTEIGMIYAKEPPQHEVKVAGMVNTRFAIPPGADNHEVTFKFPMPFDATLIGFTPHMHLRGKACKYEVTRKDKTKEVLLDIPHYDFNWQLLYRLKEPITIKAGDTLQYTAWYDNSDKNPANPDPKKTVRWGPQTYDEMMLGYVEFYVPVKVEKPKEEKSNP
ncbi:MAG: redoxin family protein [Gemmatales bacterium]